MTIQSLGNVNQRFRRIQSTCGSDQAGQQSASWGSGFQQERGDVRHHQHYYHTSAGWVLIKRPYSITPSVELCVLQMAIIKEGVDGCFSLPPPPKCECMNIPSFPRGACCGERECCDTTECLDIIIPFLPTSVYVGSCPYPLIGWKYRERTYLC